MVIAVQFGSKYPIYRLDQPPKESIVFGECRKVNVMSLTILKNFGVVNGSRCWEANSSLCYLRRSNGGVHILRFPSVPTKPVCAETDEKCHGFSSSLFSECGYSGFPLDTSWKFLRHRGADGEAQGLACNVKNKK